jgi:hypothetical protein
MLNTIEIIHPGHASHRKLPINFDPRDRALFAKSLTYQAPDVALKRYSGISVFRQKYLYDGFRLLDEGFDAPEQDRLKSSRWHAAGVYLQIGYRRAKYEFYVGREKVEEPVYWVTDPWSGNYFHWLCDAIPRLYAVWKRLKDITLLMPEPCLRNPFGPAALAPFNLPKIIPVPVRSLLYCRQFNLPTPTARSGNHNDVLVREIREFYRAHFGLSGAARASSSRRLYVSRSAAANRRLLNEEELLPVLKKRGFEILRPENLSFEEQVIAFGKADVLLSLHGAGMTNMLFMPEGSMVIELQGRDMQRNCYFTLANACRHDYAYLKCDTVPAGNRDPGADVTCAPFALESVLDQVLNTRSKQT